MADNTTICYEGKCVVLVFKINRPRVLNTKDECSWLNESIGLTELPHPEGLLKQLNKAFIRPGKLLSFSLEVI